MKRVIYFAPNGLQAYNELLDEGLVETPTLELTSAGKDYFKRACETSGWSGQYLLPTTFGKLRTGGLALFLERAGLSMSEEKVFEVLNIAEEYARNRDKLIIARLGITATNLHVIDVANSQPISLEAAREALSEAGYDLDPENARDLLLLEDFTERYGELQAAFSAENWDCVKAGKFMAWCARNEAAAKTIAQPCLVWWGKGSMFSTSGFYSAEALAAEFSKLEPELKKLWQSGQEAIEALQATIDLSEAGEEEQAAFWGKVYEKAFETETAIGNLAKEYGWKQERSAGAIPYVEIVRLIDWN